MTVTSVPGLAAFETHSVYVAAITDAGRGPEQTPALVLTTLQAACAQMVHPSVEYDAKNGDYGVSWQPPIHPNGILQRSVVNTFLILTRSQELKPFDRYQLLINESIIEYDSTNTSITSTTVSGIGYNGACARVRCFTQAGPGPWSDLAPFILNNTATTSSPGQSSSSSSDADVRDDLIAVLVPVGLAALVIAVILVTLKRRKNIMHAMPKSSLQMFLPGPDEFDVLRDSFHTIKVLATHASCTSYLASIDGLDMPAQSNVVVKMCHEHLSDADKRSFLLEAEFLKQFASAAHPNIIRILATCLLEEPLVIVLEHCSNGNLKDFLVDHPHLEWRTKLSFCRDISSGMQFLASRHVVHRELTSRSCLLDEQLCVKIGEFGWSRDLRQFHVCLCIRLRSSFID